MPLHSRDKMVAREMVGVFDLAWADSGSLFRPPLRGLLPLPVAPGLHGIRHTTAPGVGDENERSAHPVPFYARRGALNELARNKANQGDFN